MCSYNCAVQYHCVVGTHARDAVWATAWLAVVETAHAPLDLLGPGAAGRTRLIVLAVSVSALVLVLVITIILTHRSVIVSPIFHILLVESTHYHFLRIQ